MRIRIILSCISAIFLNSCASIVPCSNKVQLSLEQIPEVKEPMPVLKHDGVSVVPENRIQKIAKNVSPNAEFKKTDEVSVAYDGDLAIAIINNRTGLSEVFSKLEGLQPAKNLDALGQVAAQRLIADEALFPKDDTQLLPLKPILLQGVKNRIEGKDNGDTAEDYLAYVRLQRQVNGIPVYGPGTRAMAAVAGDGSLQALAHRWKTAKFAGLTVKPYSRERVASEIIAKLAENAKYASVKVNKITLGYYDSGQDFIQPVYRFVASLSSYEPDEALAKDHKKNDETSGDEYLVGFVSIGEESEPLLSFKNSQEQNPDKILGTLSQDKDSRLPVDDPTYGVYVVRQDSDDWWDSGVSFKQSLSLGGAFSSTPFTEKQFKWAKQAYYESLANSYVNSVQIALTEAHGNWHTFSTYKHLSGKIQSNPTAWATAVPLSDIPQTGYGPGSGGHLSYWILHSCAVIPTEIDMVNSFDDWWHIFNGLHAVVGYRTDMWIDDEVTGSFGMKIAFHAPFISSWLQTIASSDAYDDGDTYFAYHYNQTPPNYPMFNIPPKLYPYGRPSAVVVSGHSDDNVTQTNNLGKAHNLTEWWIGN
jgi:hypothetical protein